MQPSEALGIAAQVAVTLAGFAGIVVVFRPDSVRRWFSARQAPAATPAHELGLAPGRVVLWHAPSNVRFATGQHLALVQRR